MKIRELVVRNLDSEKAECLDRFRSSGLCPEVYIRKYNEQADTKITTGLIDSGAECCILSLGALQEIFGMNKSDVSPLAPWIMHCPCAALQEFVTTLSWAG